MKLGLVVGALLALFGQGVYLVVTDRSVGVLPSMVAVVAFVVVWELTRRAAQQKEFEENTLLRRTQVAESQRRDATDRYSELEALLSARLAKLEAEFKEAVLGQSFGR